MTFRARASSIRALAFGVCATIACMIGHGLYLALTEEFRRLKLAERALVVAQVNDALAHAMTAISLERSVTQVGLSLTDRLPAQFQQILDRKRQEATRSLSDIEARLTTAGDAQALAMAQELRGHAGTLAAIRRQVDAALTVGKAARPADSDMLPSRLIALIEVMSQAGDRLREREVMEVGRIAALDLAQQRIWMMREYGGRGRTFFAIATLHREPLGDETIAKMRELYGMTAQPWRLLRRAADSGQFSPRVSGMLGRIQAEYFGAYQEMRTALYAAAATGRYPIDFETFFSRSADVFNVFEESMSAIGQEMIGAAKSEIADWQSRLRTKVAIAAVQLLVFAALIWVLMFRVVRRVDALTGAVNRLASGDLSVKVEALKGTDEIGRMVEAVEVFRSNAAALRDMTAAAEAAEVERKLKREAELSALADEFEGSAGSIVASVASAAERMQDAARAMSRIAEDTSRQALGLADSARLTNDNMISVASSSDELAISIQDTASQVQRSSAMANKAADDATQTTRMVATLSEAANQIGSIVALIGEIAGKTNLLALNATIEAARAGDSGKGFAVVALEVKSLAEQTTRATAQIEDRIKAIQSSTAGAASAIGGIDATISDINHTATAIAAIVVQQSAQTSEIARNAQQACAGTQDLSSSVAFMSEAAGEGRRAAAEVLESANELAGQAEAMRTSVNRFLETVRAA